MSDVQLAAIPGPTLLVLGDRDDVRLEHAALVLDLFPDAQLVVLAGTAHVQVIRRTDALLALVPPFLDRSP